MKFETAWLHYRSNLAMAKAAGVSGPAVTLWKKAGIIPLRSAKALQAHSGGAVSVDRALYPSLVKEDTALDGNPVDAT